MVFSKDAFKFKWKKAFCQIESSNNAQARIVEILAINQNDHEFEYYPFNYKQLYLEFASINDDNEGEITKFVERYGFLHSKYENTENYLSADELQTLNHPRKRRRAIEKRPQWELIDTFTKEMKEMKELIEDWTLLQNKNSFQDITSLKAEYKALGYKEDTSNTLAKNTQLLCQARLQLGINNKLKYINPMLIPSHKSNSYNGFSFEWNVRNLLDAMYIMFAMDITENKLMRKCQNETCSRYFTIEGNDKRKIYCSNGCARAQAQREYRKRKGE